MMCLNLFYADKYNRLKYGMDMINIEAAFLEGDRDKPTSIKWPVGMLELRFITKEEFKESCIELMRSMYGNIDAAIKFFKTYKKHLLMVIGLIRSMADPCVFYKKDEQGQRTVLIATVFVDDMVLLLGIWLEINNCKAEIEKHFGYTDLGKQKKHLGVKKR
jgi:hypothetical protein